MKKMKFNRSWSDVAIVAIITLAIAALLHHLLFGQLKCPNKRLKT